MRHRGGSIRASIERARVGTVVRGREVGGREVEGPLQARGNARRAGFTCVVEPCVGVEQVSEGFDCLKLNSQNSQESERVAYIANGWHR